MLNYAIIRGLKTKGYTMKNFTLLSLIAAALLFTACEEKTTTEKVEDAVTEAIAPKTDSEKAMDALKDAAGHAKKAATHAIDVTKEESKKAYDATAKKAEELKVAAEAKIDEVSAAE